MAVWSVFGKTLTITWFVTVMMVLVEYVNVLSVDRLRSALSGSRWIQYVVAGLHQGEGDRSRGGNSGRGRPSDGRAVRAMRIETAIVSRSVNSSGAYSGHMVPHELGDPEPADV